ncbi:hypothetical protein CEXT_332001 [Caerostris extrusa]|uniref:Uncharacterized protein n=1 Tax=Caerostris extrusa TaxID=172846 RepID=A0AAV4VR15_CAEEX|nr:hypothetical protein CEXT_332001 [Caerostris extrusa]
MTEHSAERLTTREPEVSTVMVFYAPLLMSSKQHISTGIFHQSLLSSSSRIVAESLMNGLSLYLFDKHFIPLALLVSSLSCKPVFRASLPPSPGFAVKDDACAAHPLG